MTSAASHSPPKAKLLQANNLALPAQFRPRLRAGRFVMAQLIEIQRLSVRKPLL